MKRITKLLLFVSCFAMLLGCMIFQRESRTSATSKQRSTLEILITAKTATKFTSEPVSEEHIIQILSAGLN